jgi:hypothetical protein
MLLAFALLAFMPVASAVFYDVSIIRANDSNTSSLVYDDNSTSYKDSSIENPDMLLRICTAASSDLLHKYVALAYADGFDGKYIVLNHAPIQVQNVTPSGCALMPLEISSFKAWYPSIPYVFVANGPNMAGAERWKLSRSRGWFKGAYGVETVSVGHSVNVTVVNSTDDNGALIIPLVDYQVVGLVKPDFMTTDTVISVPNNTVTLNSGGSAYNIFINGIGPEIPPYVKILTPEPITYTTRTIPFTYIMLDDDDIYNCWYVLDGVRVMMPVCGIAYILNLQNGTHSITLYGNDTTGRVGSDTVAFRVGLPYVRPPIGNAAEPVNQTPPIIPPGPITPYFKIVPQDITITMDYPKEGISGFTLESNVPITDVQCFVRGDFANFTTVELETTTIEANGSITGKITVSMSPQQFLDYNMGRSGSLQCTGKTDPTLTSSTFANVYLILNKPAMESGNATIAAQPGDIVNVSSFIRNVGNGSSTFINISAVVVDYPDLLRVYQLPRILPNGMTDTNRFLLSVPTDMAAGDYLIRIDFFENGRPMGSGYVALRVLPANKKPPTQLVCNVPDLAWTLLILLLGAIVSIVVFMKVHDDEEEKYLEERGKELLGEEKPRKRS